MDALIKKQIRLIAAKEGIRLNGKHDLQTKVMVTLFGLFADIERDLISMRTREALSCCQVVGHNARKASGSTGEIEARRSRRRNQRTLRPERLESFDRQNHPSRPLDSHHFIRSRGLAERTAQFEVSGPCARPCRTAGSTESRPAPRPEGFVPCTPPAPDHPIPAPPSRR